MELNTLITVLMVAAPAVSTALTMLGLAIKFGMIIKKMKKEDDSKLIEANNKVNRAYDDIAIMKTKLASIEKYLVEKEEQK